MVFRFMVNGYSVCLLSSQYHVVAIMHALTTIPVSPVTVFGVVQCRFNRYLHIGIYVRIQQ